MKRNAFAIALAIACLIPSIALAQQGGGGGAGGMGSGGAGGSQDVDADQDGYLASEDCDDENPEVNPGAAELCNGSDDNCDGQVDEEVMLTFYRDDDGDGFGDPNSSDQMCSVTFGFVENGSDCDDASSETHPNGQEVCDGWDNDCDGIIDEDCYDNYDDYDAGPTPSANMVSGLLLAAWLGFGAWRRRRKLR